MKKLSELPILVIDVESIGLYGEGYAVAGALYRNRKMLEYFKYACNPHMADGTLESHKWVKENVPYIKITHIQTSDMRKQFFAYWEYLKRSYPGVIMVAECGYPVEANFLEACINDNHTENEFKGPYPLHDIASFMLLAGMDPMKTYDRLPDELPKHDPLCDVRQSARLMYEAFAIIEKYKHKFYDGGGM